MVDGSSRMKGVGGVLKVREAWAGLVSMPGPEEKLSSTCFLFKRGPFCHGEKGFLPKWRMDFPRKGGW
jgi:hypothetical protein